MDFVNNWSRPVTLAAGATSLALDLPDGTYRLTCASAPSGTPAWEIIDAVVSGGVATLARGVEGTADQDWPDGSIIYCSFTAGQLAVLLARVSDLETRVAALEPPPPLEGYVLRWIYSNGDSVLTQVEPFAGGMQYAPLDLGSFSSAGAAWLPDYNGWPAVALDGSGEYITELGLAYDPALTMFRITFNPNNRYADVTARIELDGNVLGETVFNSGSEGANPSVIEISIQ